MPDLDQLRRLVDGLLDQTRRILLAAAQPQTWTKLTDDGRREVVSDLDLRVERLLIDGLTCALGSDLAVCAEESEHDAAAFTAPWGVVLDPIDGTRELLDGRAGYATTMAVLRHGTPVLGVTDFPARDQRFHADPSAGGGITLNGRSLPSRSARPGATRLLVAVSPGQLRRGRLTPLLAACPSLIPVPTGAAANKLAQLALGDVDAAVYLPTSNQVLALWDHLSLTIALPALGARLCALADDHDFVADLPVYWRDGWVAGPAGLRGLIRAAWQEGSAWSPDSTQMPTAG